MSGCILVAHAGGTGWDEIAVFALPVVILVGLQALGRRRARSARIAAEGEGQGDEPGGGGDAPPGSP